MKDKTEGLATDRYTTGVACKSWHGSLNRSDSYVPFIVAYPGGNGEEIGAQLIDVTGIVRDANGSYSGDYNYRLSDVVRKIITEQYQ